MLVAVLVIIGVLMPTSNSGGIRTNMKHAIPRLKPQSSSSSSIRSSSSSTPRGETALYQTPPFTGEKSVDMGFIETFSKSIHRWCYGHKSDSSLELSLCGWFN